MGVNDSDRKDEYADPRTLMSTGRVEAFSDGVFAIVISLLILNIHLPTLKDVAGTNLLPVLLAAWPSWLSYIVSFLLVGMGWINHHQLFRTIRHVDVTVLALNVVLLMLMTVFPFTTALLAEYLLDPAGQHTAAVIYGAILTCVSVLYFAIWWYALARGMLVTHLSKTAIRAATRRRIIGVAAYSAATGIAFISAPVSISISFIVAGYYFVTSSGPRIANKSTP